MKGAFAKFGFVRSGRHIPCCLCLALLVLAACGPGPAAVVDREPVPRGIPERGRQLIQEYGCGACHTVPGVPFANALLAPPLNDFDQRRYIAGAVVNEWENLVQWIQDPHSIEPNTAMPNLGVTEPDARHIAAYLYDQPRSTILWWPVLNAGEEPAN